MKGYGTEWALHGIGMFKMQPQIKLEVCMHL